MKKIYFLFFALLTMHSVYGQWFQLNSGVLVNLHSVFCVNDSVVFAAGDAGYILKTTNGGTTWIQENSTTPQRLNSIFFADANTGYAVGNNGTIVKTTDGGTTWSQQISPVTTALNSVFFTSIDTGYAVGSTTLIKTTDGGTNWVSDSTIFPCCVLLNSITFISPSKGFILGYDLPGAAIISTIDGGNTWNTIFDYNATSDNWWIGRAMAVDSAGTPVVAGDNGRIENGYGMWNMYGSAVGTTTLNAVCNKHNNPINSTYAFTAVGANGVIGLYPNMGPATCNQVSGVTSGLNSIMFYDSQIGYIAGDGGVILKTINGGYIMNGISTNNTVDFSISPDPFSTEAVLTSPENLENATLTFYNSLGEKVKEMTAVSGQKITLHRDNLPAGIYFISVQQKNKFVGTKKLVIQD